MMECKTIGVISVLCGKIMGEPADIFQVLNFMTGDDLYTSMLPLAMEVCGPFLALQFPELAKSCDKDLAPLPKRTIKELVRKFGEVLTINPLPETIWFSRDPLAAMKNEITNMESVK